MAVGHSAAGPDGCITLWHAADILPACLSSLGLPLDGLSSEQHGYVGRARGTGIKAEKGAKTEEMRRLDAERKAKKEAAAAKEMERQDA